jgi:hypothetical protein
VDHVSHRVYSTGFYLANRGSMWKIPGISGSGRSAPKSNPVTKMVLPCAV